MVLQITKEEYKFFSKPLLKEANEAAHREKRSKCIDPKILQHLSDNFIFYITRVFYHKKNEVRLMIITDENNTVELLDVSVTRYESLPSIEFFDNGKFEVHFSKRPYPNGRAWQEVEIKKPIRQQDKFRTEVLSKYDNTCAVCDNNHKSLLRAAHILPVVNGGPDTIKNGISLCVNHEIAFDRGIIEILPNYQVIAPQNIGVNVNKLKLPLKEEDYPSPNFLKDKLYFLNKTDGIAD